MNPLDWQADLIRRWFSPHRQMHAGVLMIDVSFVYMGWWKWSGEPFGIFTMSVLALFFAGVIMVTDAAMAEKQEKE